jgi:hypothetical protein
MILNWSSKPLSPEIPPDRRRLQSTLRMTGGPELPELGAEVVNMWRAFEILLAKIAFEMS